MSVAGKALTGLIGVLGIPLAWLVVQQGFATGWVAAVLLALYEVVILLGAIVASVAQQVVRRRIEQVMDVVDLALGRRVSRYARYYRRYVLEREGHINARDLAHTPSHIPELDAVYVDVGLAPGSPSGKAGGLLPAPRVDQTRRQSIHDFLDQERPAVCAVIGAPGSGKSTLLRHTARLAANQGKDRRRRIPVMLALRDHAESLTTKTSESPEPPPTLAHLIRADVGTLAVAEPPGWWEVQLRAGNCLILLDGLDEVARSEHRAAIAEWIEKQIAKHPKNDFVITSRPHGYKTAVIPQATVLQVRPFTTQQIRQFVLGWCRAAERLATGASGPEIDQRAREEAEDLISQLSSAPALMELAVNPLLLTMMVLVHRDRRSLPAGRADLYDQVCDVMLWRRQESKKLEVKPPGTVRQRILAALAYDMMVAETRDYPKHQVLEVFNRVLQQVDSDISAEDLLTALVETSGLLVEREKDLYAFAHHTLGEYLASKHIRSKNLVSTLVRSVGDPWWRETTLLYVTDADAHDIVEACLKKNTGASLALAFDCVWHGQLDREVRASLDRLLKEAFEDGADPERRRLIASALAAGHLSRLVTDEHGTMLCPYPIPEHLYWLFCEDTGVPFPEGMNEMELDPSRPAAGIWRSDVRAFIDWINSVDVPENATTFRLPTSPEVEFLMSNGTAQSQDAELRRTAWTASAQGTVARKSWSADESDPLEVTGEDLLIAVRLDLVHSPLIIDFILAGIRLDARAIADAFSRSLSHYSRGTYDDEVEYAFLTTKDLLLNVEIVRMLLQDSFPAYDLKRAHKLDFQLVHGLAKQLASTQPSARNLTHSLALARQLDDAFSSASQFSANFDPRTLDYASTRKTAFENVMGRTLTQVLTNVASDTEVMTHTDKKFAVPKETFELSLLECSGVFGYRLLFSESVDLDSLFEKLRVACSAMGGDNVNRREPIWAPSVAWKLLHTAEPVLTRTQRPLLKDFANVRIPALLLAGEAELAGNPSVASAFRSVAAGVTLLEHRLNGTAPLEIILLARE
ncbi:NACHT domain-containing protein [Glycomyces sp. TRM65418]|uniref:NACHT domain-containing protein n=1 Tax=Glycomyces sp. TRM65418 TaxID=2867006 RepID=UPI001CE6B274|nr:NACHT domain-containing protein [Glycomyces sp. TRM65418]MCC3764514.1 NACHT domain-containing protein [Glycomyces sp. TRM65418]QZD54183.1 NACHT domain-containing protein [Glycomyces sp. TRM65418]